MITNSNAQINAVVADASYINLERGLDESTIRQQLTTRMTRTLAAYIAANFEVVSSQNNSDIPFIGSGFDAIVWRGKLGGEYSGQVFVSMRGTEPASAPDLSADLDPAFNRSARSQISDMATVGIDWQQLSAEAKCCLRSVKGNRLPRFACLRLVNPIASRVKLPVSREGL